MNNSTTHEEFTFHPSPDTKELHLGIFILTFVCGMVGNCLVVCVVNGKKKQRTVSDLLVVSLAVSDILYLLLNIPVNIVFHLHGLVYNAFYCKFVLPMMTVTFFLCVFTLTTMAIHRCIGILHPYSKKLSLKQASLVIVVIWIMAVIPVIPLMVVSEALPEYSVCFEFWKKEHHRKSYTVVLFFLQYLLPLLVISIAYMKIVRYLFGSKVPRVFINDIGAVRRRMSREENRPVVRTLAAIVIAYAVCMLPHQVCGILWDFGGHKEQQMVIYMVDYTNMLLLIHSCVNPIIYGTLTKHFRNSFMKYIFKICRPCKPTIQRPRYYAATNTSARHLQSYYRDSINMFAYTVSTSASSRSVTRSSTTMTRITDGSVHSSSGSSPQEKVSVMPTEAVRFHVSKASVTKCYV